MSIVILKLPVNVASSGHYCITFSGSCYQGFLSHFIKASHVWFHSQSQQSEEKPVEPIVPVVSAAVTPTLPSPATAEPSPAEFWSRLKEKQQSTPTNVPLAIPASPPETRTQTVSAVSPSQQSPPAKAPTAEEGPGAKMNKEKENRLDEEIVQEKESKTATTEKEGNMEKEGKEDKKNMETKTDKEARDEKESNKDGRIGKASTSEEEHKTLHTNTDTVPPSTQSPEQEKRKEVRVEGATPESSAVKPGVARVAVQKKRPAEVKTALAVAESVQRNQPKENVTGGANATTMMKQTDAATSNPLPVESSIEVVAASKPLEQGAEAKDELAVQEANRSKLETGRVIFESPKPQDARPEGFESECRRSPYGEVVNGVFIPRKEEIRLLKKEGSLPDDVSKAKPVIPTENAAAANAEKKSVKFAEPLKEEIGLRSFPSSPKGILSVDLAAHSRNSSPPRARKSARNTTNKTNAETTRKDQGEQRARTTSLPLTASYSTLNLALWFVCLWCD